MTLHARDILLRCLSQACQRCHAILSRSYPFVKIRVFNASLDDILILISLIFYRLLHLSGWKAEREATEILSRENVDKRCTKGNLTSTLKISALFAWPIFFKWNVLILGLKSSNFSSEKYGAISGRNDTEYRKIFQQYCSLRTIENIYPEYMLLKNKLIYNI